MELSPISVAVAVTGLALALTVGAGIASADPNLDSAVNSTCSYDQVMSALNVQHPGGVSPQAQSALRQFIAAAPGQRRQMAEAIASYPANQPYLGLLQTTFDTCNNF
ncbi:hemophore-related protein [Mycobacterium sp. 21AC1]|uniref:hemophore-related protein n=1 Tax=[Mycobacterium] appelbergii TaxID=2939269 RepID=UPI0029391A2F|nr:hemophore-related protein [Mycobacterium sp. 21AC1]MDV3129286.1 hemophore-related protein [Mycobacterium sp. 21AC1]